MPNKDVFCNVPWTNLHVYWNGQYGYCCNTTIPPPSADNIKTSTIIEWYNSESLKDFRKRILDKNKLSECSECYHAESIGNQSKRIRENYKTAIFPYQNFEKSFLQSKWLSHFTETSKKLPIDWHIDLGNECNLTCKMCNPYASSKIASQYNKWNIQYNLYDNWTNDDQLWDTFLLTIKNSNVKRLHLMGGEPTLNKRFSQLLEYLISNDLTNLSLSFVTNGTKISKELINRLNRIKEVNIELSIETINNTNDYIRQGTNTSEVIKNIEFITSSTNHQLILRTVPQLLSVANYHNLIRYAREKNFYIQSTPLQDPEYFYIPVLPITYRRYIKTHYIKLLNEIQEQSKANFTTISIGRDPNHLDQQFINEINAVINLLDKPEPINADTLRKDCVQWMRRWDEVAGFDAYHYYPELHEFLNQYGY